MPDDPLALTLHAQPPGEGDYEAIHEAVMQSGRGRWFLHEFARRNRQADTRLLLAAIDRIEGTIASRTAAAAPPAPTIDTSGLRESLAQAKAALCASGGDPDFAALARTLTTQSARIRSSLEHVQEIAWELREDNPSDARCDELDDFAREIASACVALEAAQDRAYAMASLLADIEARIGPQPAPAEGSDEPRPVTVAQAEAPPAEPEPVAIVEPATAADRSETATSLIAALHEDGEVVAAVEPNAEPQAEEPQISCDAQVEVHSRSPIESSAAEPESSEPPAPPPAKTENPGWLDALAPPLTISPAPDSSELIELYARAEAASREITDADIPIEIVQFERVGYDHAADFAALTGQTPPKPEPVVETRPTLSVPAPLPPVGGVEPAQGPADFLLEPWPRDMSAPPAHETPAPSPAAHGQGEAPAPIAPPPPAATPQPAAVVKVVVPKPAPQQRPAPPDPLAPVTALSEEEKIALFS